MKFENKKPTAESIEIHAQKQVEKRKELFASVGKHKGHTMYEIDCTTGEIREVEYEQEKAYLVNEVDLYTGQPTGKTISKVRKEVECKANCLYISALNKKSAKKKYLKYLLENARIIK